MKKLLAITLLCALLVTGCAKSEPAVLAIAETPDITATPTTEPVQTSAPTPTPEPTPEPLPERDTDFRFGVWGDDMETVIAYEEQAGNKIAEQTEEAVSYMNINLLNYDYNATYMFCDQGLYNGGYIFNEKSQVYAYPNIYNEIKESLTSIYGDPTMDKVHKINPSMIDFSDNDGQAIQLGYMAYEATWETDDTNIRIALLADSSYNMMLPIIYTSKTIIPPTDTSGL